MIFQGSRVLQALRVDPLPNKALSHPQNLVEIESFALIEVAK